MFRCQPVDSACTEPLAGFTANKEAQVMGVIWSGPRNTQEASAEMIFKTLIILGAWGGQKGTLGLMELDFQVVLSHPAWVLGTELWEQSLGVLEKQFALLTAEHSCPSQNNVMFVHFT